MKIYISEPEAVIDLHERGFTEDFHLLGNDLLWIQRGFFLRQRDFAIDECHTFIDSSGKKTVIFGITASSFYASGILINHYRNYTDKTPAIIQNKLKKMTAGILNIQGNYLDVQIIR